MAETLNSSDNAPLYEGISIIIPTFQGAAYLEELLISLEAQDYPASIEVIAIDSGSTDDTLPILRRFGTTVISLPPECFSHGHSRNLGVRRASQPIVVFLSQDAVLADAATLRMLVSALQMHEVGAVYARQLPRITATPLEIFFQERLYPAQSRRFKVEVGEQLKLDRLFFSNVCSAARRETCLAFPFNETLLMSEDQAFARELLLREFATYYTSEACVIHSHSYTLLQLFRRNFDSAYSLQGIAEDRWSDLLRQGSDYVLAEARYLIRRKKWRWLLYMPFYELTRILGRLIGGHANLLARRWLHSISLNRAYWSRESHTSVHTSL